MILLNEPGTHVRGQEAAKRRNNVQIVIAYMAEKYGKCRALYTVIPSNGCYQVRITPR